MIYNPQSGGTHLPALTSPAGAGQILSGYQAINADGEIVTGTIPSQGAQTITPGTANKTIAAGRYLSGTQTIAGDSDLIGSNIKSGVNLFGVNGSATIATFTHRSSSNVVTFTIPGINGKHFYIFAGELGKQDDGYNVITGGQTVALYGDSINNIYETVAEVARIGGGEFQVKVSARPYTGTASVSGTGIRFTLTYEMQLSMTVIYY